MLALLTAIAFTVGIGPVASALDEPLVLAGGFGVAALVAGFSLLSFQSPGTARPSVPEFLLATVDAISPAAVLGIYFFAVYAVVDWAIWALSFTGLDWNRRYIALVAAAAVSLPFGIVVAFITVDGMKEKLYPAVAGVPSHYHGLAASRRRVALVVFGGLVVSAAAIAFLLATKNSSSLLSFLLLLYTVGVATGASPPTEEAEPGRASADAVQALAEAFKASGYEVVPHPQTGEPEVDPLLVELDLFAHKGERGLAIQIKQGSRTSEPLTWTDASRLATAAQVLEFDLPAFRPADLDQAELPSFVERVQPVLVLVDVDADQSLLTFCRAERVTVFNIRTAERSAGIIDRDQSDLAEVAEYYAALLAAERPAQASRAEVAAV